MSARTVTPAAAREMLKSRLCTTDGCTCVRNERTALAATVASEPARIAAAVEAERSRAEAAEREVARLRRLMETAPPWEVSDPPTDEELRALRQRWAFGPERYQADADTLIAAALHHREERQAITAERDALRAIIAGRTTPPTDAEIDAHDAAGGSWDVVVTVEGRHFPMTVSVQGMVRDTRDGIVVRRDETKRWRPRDAARDICVWPVVTEVTP